jgi:hypothetical protein
LLLILQLAKICLFNDLSIKDRFVLILLFWSFWLEIAARQQLFDRAVQSAVADRARAAADAPAFLKRRCDRLRVTPLVRAVVSHPSKRFRPQLTPAHKSEPNTHRIKIRNGVASE